MPFPYTDQLAEKRRPALVVSNPALEKLGYLWVAMVTSRRAESGMTGDVVIEDITLAGLPAPSVVRTAKIACIEPQRVQRVAGKLTQGQREQVFNQMHRFLGA
ncbi:MAG: type II toxin-antitoxin system PemK/MazF family toxin [Methylobacterium sp.]|nr:type II toxin-antitoxin system PemK/MazF family toxin [Methylobacterium sp.]MCA3599707.1 type II toxin-antitoxin system PemK/MazF family toxin [Methylobacterium sp.]MCA3606838.1 type II toxin-antitoxin system PemK/MazF family toxin [Methylobacterium sp.]MCA3608485.1 type II toxin-antitoxin system PemK/MazF family toxin [Methylobacterium sp.]MCA3617514.1 type II toxin-antitoxin system PemK/MazF family toxin [Methylobacterium sp.]